MKRISRSRARRIFYKDKANLGQSFLGKYPERKFKFYITTKGVIAQKIKGD